MRRLINLFARSSTTIPKGPIVAPDRVLIWSPGDVIGDFGQIVWDAQAAADLMQTYRDRGNPIPIDVQHNTNPDANPKLDLSNPPKGGGYTELEVDAAGRLWASNIAWSSYAREEIESGSRRAISPDWLYDKTTGRPVRMVKVSLVQDAGTYGIGLMASAASVGMEKKTMDPLAMLKAALVAAQSNKDPKAMADALAAIVAEIDKMMGAGGGADSAVVDPAMEAAADPALAEVKKACASALAALEKSGVHAATASAAAPKFAGMSESAIRSIVRSEVASASRDNAAIEQLIASAKSSPGYSDGLATELRGLPVQTVKRIVMNLAPSAAIAGATAGAADAGVKTGPLAGATAASTVSAAEQESIDMINGASPSVSQAIASAEKAAKDGAKNGIGVFSALPQIQGAKKAS